MNQPVAKATNKRESPRVTVVIPAYNRANLVNRTLESVMAQTVPPAELILVDNHSTDGTLAVLEDFAARHADCGFPIKVLTERTRGAAAARNRGLAEAESPWTLFFDSDDEMKPGHLQRLSETLARHPEADIVGWDLDMHFEGTGKTRRKRFAAGDMYYKCVIHGGMATARYAARTDLFRAVGGWDTRLSTWDDVELGVRLLRCNPTVVKAKGEPMVSVSVHSDSITGMTFLGSAEATERALDVIEQGLPEGSRWYADLRRAVLAGAYAREGDPERGRWQLERSLAAGRLAAWKLRLAFEMTRRGIPGAGRLVRFLTRR